MQSEFREHLRVDGKSRARVQKIVDNTLRTLAILQELDPDDRNLLEASRWVKNYHKNLPKP